MENPNVSVGRIVHYVLPDGRSNGQCWPAMVVAVLTDSPTSMVNLQVFTNMINDGEDTPLVWKTSVMAGEYLNDVLGTWHWPERAAIPVGGKSSS